MGRGIKRRRQGKNLGRVLATRQFTSTEEKQECFKCDRRCGKCTIIKEEPTCSITIQLTGQNLIIKKEATCRTGNVLYILTCSGCGEQYVVKHV